MDYATKIDKRIFGLSHITSEDTLIRILNMGSLVPRIQLGQRPVEHEFYDQYPGVYLGIIFDPKLGVYGYGQEHSSYAIMLVFCRELLLRGDFHFNIFDYFGSMGSDTFTLRTLSKGIDLAIKGGTTEVAEVVFHDAIPLKFLSEIRVTSDFPIEKIPKPYRHLIHITGATFEKTKCKKHPKAKTPNYCYAGTENATLFNLLGKQTLATLYKTAYNCGMTKEEILQYKNRDELREAIEERSIARYKNKSSIVPDQFLPPFEDPFFDMTDEWINSQRGGYKRMPPRNKKYFRTTKSGAGMTRAGVMEYRRLNPGSKLSTAVTGRVKPGSKAAKRRKSYCARSAGQMKMYPKAAKNPNSRLRQARRRWRCK